MRGTMRCSPNVRKRFKESELSTRALPRQRTQPVLKIAATPRTLPSPTQRSRKVTSAERVVFSVLKKYALTEKVLLFAPTEGYVRKGALVALENGEAAVATAMANVGANVLSGREQPEDIGMVFAGRPKLYVNLKVAKAIGLSLPAVVVSRAEERY